MSGPGGQLQPWLGQEGAPAPEAADQFHAGNKPSLDRSPRPPGRVEGILTVGGPTANACQNPRRQGWWLVEASVAGLGTAVPLSAAESPLPAARCAPPQIEHLSENRASRKPYR